MVAGVAIVVREYLLVVRHVQLPGVPLWYRSTCIGHRGTGVLSDGWG